MHNTMSIDLLKQISVFSESVEKMNQVIVEKCIAGFGIKWLKTDSLVGLPKVKGDEVIIYLMEHDPPMFGMKRSPFMVCRELKIPLEWFSMSTEELQAHIESKKQAMKVEKERLQKEREAMLVDAGIIPQGSDPSAIINAEGSQCFVKDLQNIEGESVFKDFFERAKAYMEKKKAENELKKTKDLLQLESLMKQYHPDKVELLK